MDVSPISTISTTPLFTEQPPRTHSARRSKRLRYTDGDNIRRRVDKIAEDIAQDLLSHNSTRRLSSTRCPQEHQQLEEEKAANRQEAHDATGVVSHPVGQDSGTEQQSTVPCAVEDDAIRTLIPITLPSDATNTAEKRNLDVDDVSDSIGGVKIRPPIEVGQASAATDDSRADRSIKRGVDHLGTVCDGPGPGSAKLYYPTGHASASANTPMQLGANATPGDTAIDRSTQSEGAVVADNTRFRPAPDPVTSTRPVLDNPLAANHATASIVPSTRPASARKTHSAKYEQRRASPGFCSSSSVSSVRRSVSSPGLVQGDHRHGWGSKAIAKYFAEGQGVQDRLVSRSLLQEMNDSTGGNAYAGKAGAGALGKEQGEGGGGGGGYAGGGGSCNAKQETEAGTSPQREDRERASQRTVAPEGRVVPHSNSSIMSRPAAGSDVFATAEVRCQPDRRLAKSAAAPSEEVKTSLDFRNATVKLKVRLLRYSVGYRCHVGGVAMRGRSTKVAQMAR